MGAKQQPTEPINVGSITIVDDDGKFTNNSSQQTKGRKLFQNSRNLNGQQTGTTDFSNLQTKQLGIQRFQMLQNKRIADSVNSSQVQHDVSDRSLTPPPNNQMSGCYGIPGDSTDQKRS